MRFYIESLYGCDIYDEKGGYMVYVYASHESIEPDETSGKVHDSLDSARDEVYSLGDNYVP